MSSTCRAASCDGSTTMQRNRALVHPDRVRELFAEQRDELRRMGERHLAQVAVLRARIAALEGEIEEVRAQHADLRAAVLARTKAEVEVQKLRRLQAIGRAKLAARDPQAPLN